MVADAEQRKKELEALNEADGPVFKMRGTPGHARGVVSPQDQH